MNGMKKELETWNIFILLLKCSLNILIITLGD
jgi:hypothetical protein